MATSHSPTSNSARACTVCGVCSCQSTPNPSLCSGLSGMCQATGLVCSQCGACPVCSEQVACDSGRVWIDFPRALLDGFILTSTTAVSPNGPKLLLSEQEVGSPPNPISISFRETSPCALWGVGLVPDSYYSDVRCLNNPQLPAFFTPHIAIGRPNTWRIDMSGKNVGVSFDPVQFELRLTVDGDEYVQTVPEHMRSFSRYRIGVMTFLGCTFERPIGIPPATHPVWEITNRGAAQTGTHTQLPPPRQLRAQPPTAWSTMSTHPGQDESESSDESDAVEGHGRAASGALVPAHPDSGTDSETEDAMEWFQSVIATESGDWENIQNVSGSEEEPLGQLDRDINTVLHLLRRRQLITGHSDSASPNSRSRVPTTEVHPDSGSDSESSQSSAERTMRHPSEFGSLVFGGYPSRSRVATGTRTRSPMISSDSDYSEASEEDEPGGFLTWQYNHPPATVLIASSPLQHVSHTAPPSTHSLTSYTSHTVADVTRRGIMFDIEPRVAGSVLLTGITCCVVGPCTLTVFIASDPMNCASRECVPLPSWSPTSSQPWYGFQPLVATHIAAEEDPIEVFLAFARPVQLFRQQCLYIHGVGGGVSMYRYPGRDFTGISNYDGQLLIFRQLSSFYTLFAGETTEPLEFAGQLHYELCDPNSAESDVDSSEEECASAINLDLATAVGFTKEIIDSGEDEVTALHTPDFAPCTLYSSHVTSPRAPVLTMRFQVSGSPMWVVGIIPSRALNTQDYLLSTSYGFCTTELAESSHHPPATPVCAMHDSVVTVSVNALFGVLTVSTGGQESRIQVSSDMCELGMYLGVCLLEGTVVRCAASQPADAPPLAISPRLSRTSPPPTDHQRQPRPPEHSSAAASPPPLPTVEGLLRENAQLKAEIKRLRTQQADALCCVVCLGDRRSVLLKPCKHVCMCENCFARINQSQDPACPVCREVYFSYDLIYL